MVVKPLSKYIIFRVFFETYKNGLKHVFALTPSYILNSLLKILIVGTQQNPQTTFWVKHKKKKKKKKKKKQVYPCKPKLFSFLYESGDKRGTFDATRRAFYYMEFTY